VNQLSELAEGFKMVRDGFARLAQAAEGAKDSDLLTPAEAARQLGCSAKTVLREVKAKKLAAERHSAQRIRIRQSALEAYRKSRR